MSSAGFLSMDIGPMFSGKTTNMISNVVTHYDTNKSLRYLIITSVKDVRSSSVSPSTHSSQGINIPEDIDVKSTLFLSNIDVSSYDVIGIDEGNMYPDVIESVKNMVNSGKDVFISALDGSSDQKPFNNDGMYDVLPLIPFADDLQYHKAICKDCIGMRYQKPYRNASFSRCNIRKDSEILVGGSEIYSACCRKHLVIYDHETIVETNIKI